MLHEILLSLSGHPSPLLRSAAAAGPHAASAGPAAPTLGGSVITAPERELLVGVAHLSDLHVKLLTFCSQVAASHPSAICRAVAVAIQSTHLAAFQRKVLAVEESILRNDASLVGAYDIVPLTAVVGEFEGWTRRMEWLWQMMEVMLLRERTTDGRELACTGARIMNRLRAELQTGYQDLEEAAKSLVRVAETAWVKQVSAWILYGRLPGFGAGDFFIQAAEDTEEEFVCISALLPSFVTPQTAASMLFIGRSLNHIRARSKLEGGMQGMDHLSSQLSELSKLTYPLDSASFYRTVTGIRIFLSQSTLQKLLPLSKVLDMLQLLRDFFLLGRGEFAMALTQQADDKMRSRWRREENLAHEKREMLGNMMIKEGEVIAVLTKVWTAMGSMQGQQADEDEGLDLARDLLRLNLVKTNAPKTTTRGGPLMHIAPTPFSNLMFSAPVALSLRVPSPIDLFLSASDIQVYTAIHAYLHSIRRAHLRLTELWKITPLRRHHPPPPRPSYGRSKAGRARVILLRERQARRMLSMRNTWTTCSASIFFLAEIEGYLQLEVVAKLWKGFQQWLTQGMGQPAPSTVPSRSTSRAQSRMLSRDPDAMDIDGEQNNADVWLAESSSRRRPPPRATSPQDRHSHDPQTLAIAHRLYLSTLVRRILLSHRGFTDALYALLGDIDQLIALTHRLQEVWNAIDLEEDVGVVDAFVDLESEEVDIKSQIARLIEKIKSGIEIVIDVLRNLDPDHEGSGNGGGGGSVSNQYVPERVGSVDQLLMKLDFGSWFAS
ncbi:gamma-tubulin complex component protein, partial [Coniella lustricola]